MPRRRNLILKRVVISKAGTKFYFNACTPDVFEPNRFVSVKKNYVFLTDVFYIGHSMRILCGLRLTELVKSRDYSMNDYAEDLIERTPTYIKRGYNDNSNVVKDQKVKETRMALPQTKPFVAYGEEVAKEPGLLNGSFRVHLLSTPFVPGASSRAQIVIEDGDYVVFATSRIACDRFSVDSALKLLDIVLNLFTTGSKIEVVTPNPSVYKVLSRELTPATNTTALLVSKVTKRISGVSWADTKHLKGAIEREFKQKRLARVRLFTQLANNVEYTIRECQNLNQLEA